MEWEREKQENRKMEKRNGRKIDRRMEGGRNSEGEKGRKPRISIKRRG